MPALEWINLLPRTDNASDSHDLTDESHGERHGTMVVSRLSLVLSNKLDCIVYGTVLGLDGLFEVVEFVRRPENALETFAGRRQVENVRDTATRGVDV